MSVINAVYATPSRVRGAIRILLHVDKNRLNRTLLENTLTPLAVSGTPDLDEEKLDNSSTGHLTMIHSVINEMIKMGLIATDQEQGEVWITESVLNEVNITDQGEGLQNIISKLFYSQDNTENHDFAMLATWFLCQNSYIPMKWEEFEIALIQQIGDQRLGCTNKTRFDQFVYWATYLGICWSYDIEKKVVIPDPTKHIRALLPLIFLDTETLLVGQIMKRLATLCPLLEGGFFRNEINELYQVENKDNRYLSFATSLAWFRLQEEGEILLEHKSDADMFIFPGVQQEFQYSGITWRRKELI